MSFNLVLSQGRVADRSEKTIFGAFQTAEAIKQRYGVNPIVVGKPSNVAKDDWSVSLPQAHDTLVALHSTLDPLIQNDFLTVLVSNTCSVSLASLPSVALHHSNAKILWIDAHCDFNTPTTTESGYLGGMVVSAVCGLWDSGHGSGLNTNQIAIIGGRDIDPAEQTLVSENGILVISPTQCKSEIINKFVGKSKVWIHIDWDVLEPSYVPADFEVDGGILPTQLRNILATLPKEQILGLELAEYKVPDDDKHAKKAMDQILEIVEPVLCESVKR